jgi:glycoprotein endo-alpha-1,2-mannosidase
VLLEQELGNDPELLDRVRTRLYEVATRVEANEIIVVGPEQVQALRDLADAILDIIRDLPGSSEDDATARIDEIGDLIESVAPELRTEPISQTPAPSVPLPDRPTASSDPESVDDDVSEAEPQASEPGPDAPRNTNADPVASAESEQDSPPEPATAEASPAAAAPLDPAYAEAMRYSVDRRIATMYYNWYGNLETDGAYRGWDDLGARPPREWSSEYEPVLGLYSSNDPAVVEQHMQWLRRAGIGTIVAPWFGPGADREEVVRLMEIADRYDIDVALRLEGDVVAQPSRLFSWVRYLLREFASRPNYARTVASSPASPVLAERPLVFVFGADTNFGAWAEALAQVRSLDGYPLMVASSFEFEAVARGTFDGLAFSAISRPTVGVYRSASLLPEGSIFVPSITPGYARYQTRDGLTSRFDGGQMDRQIGWALNSAVPPSMILITSFNRWEDGTQIEPARESDVAPRDYGEIGPDGYLAKTREIADAFLAWTPRELVRLRMEVETTSDWSELHLSRLEWGAARILEDGGPQTEGEFDWDQSYFVSRQNITRAERGRTVRHVIELSVPRQAVLEFGIKKGGLGVTTVVIDRVDRSGGSETVQRVGEFQLESPRGLAVTWFEVGVE